MATVESAVTFSAGAVDGYTSEDLISTPMTVVVVEVREPLFVQITEVVGS